MAGRKKAFPCGHIGKGQYCHRCEQEEKSASRPNETLDWKKSFESDAINLTLLPSKSLVIKARSIIASIKNGESHTKFRGKRLQCDRNIISIPLNDDYRMIFIVDGVRLTPHKVLSHEEYNSKRPGII